MVIVFQWSRIWNGAERYYGDIRLVGKVWLDLDGQFKGIFDIGDPPLPPAFRPQPSPLTLVVQSCH